MSAMTEILVEQLRTLGDKIRVTEEQGGDVTELREAFKRLTEKFESATQVLSEGKSILKG